MGLGDNELRQLQEALLTNPQPEDIIQGANGFFLKYALPLKDRKKAEAAELLMWTLLFMRQFIL
jgi:hypothetical protein